MPGPYLSSIERKVLGAMLILANDDYEVTATHEQLAQKMGYLRSGGGITNAIKMLDVYNHIRILDRGKYKVLY